MALVTVDVSALELVLYNVMWPHLSANKAVNHLIAEIKSTVNRLRQRIFDYLTVEHRVLISVDLNFGVLLAMQNTEVRSPQGLRQVSRVNRRLNLS